MEKCPFCGGKAELKVDDWVNPNGYEYGSGKITYVQCTYCNAKGGYENIDTFSRFTKYSVKDFRESTLLRAVEEERYDNYVDEQKKSAMDSWNIRKQNEL